MNGNTLESHTLEMGHQVMLLEKLETIFEWFDQNLKCLRTKLLFCPQTFEVLIRLFKYKHGETTQCHEQFGLGVLCHMYESVSPPFPCA